MLNKEADDMSSDKGFVGLPVQRVAHPVYKEDNTAMKDVYRRSKGVGARERTRINDERLMGLSIVL